MADKRREMWCDWETVGWELGDAIRSIVGLGSDLQAAQYYYCGPALCLCATVAMIGSDQSNGTRLAAGAGAWCAMTMRRSSFSLRPGRFQAAESHHRTHRWLLMALTAFRAH
jgi:hypothetical protein